MSTSDRLNFAEEKIFKVACENLPKSDGKTKNLIDCKDDILFIWDSKKKCLLTQNVKALNRNLVVYQELHLTRPPLLDVHFLRLNESVRWAALWGPGGVTVVEIPMRWGSSGGFQGGKSIILVRSVTIDLKYGLLKDVIVQQVRFHPGSPKDDDLVILTSDNTLRTYKLTGSDGVEKASDSSEVEPVHVWTLGKNPENAKNWNLGSGKVSFLFSLGDNAVDFDFCLPIINEEEKKSESDDFAETIWPIIILRGNGDICYLTTSLTSKHEPKFEGPLLMYPPADDNYGVEACSVLVMATVPSILVVATSSGTLYHSVLLKTDQQEKIGMSTAHALHVLECVELELGIALSDDDSSYTCPIFLHADPVCRWKYYTTHNTGVHAVSVSFVPQIENYFEKSSSENVCLDQPTTAEYLVCTRTNSTPILPVLGLTIVTSTNVILALLANAAVISLPLKISEVLPNYDLITPDKVVNEEVTPIKKLLQEPFDLHIKSILKRNVNQPIIKLDKNSQLSSQESLDLITRTTNLFRQEYFTKFQLVRDETEQRVMTLRALLTLHLSELSDLDKEKAILQATAEKLAEKYEEIKDKQQLLNEKIEKTVSTILQLEPIESLAEKKMKNELILVDEKVESFRKAIATLKKKFDYQKFKIDAHNQKNDKSIQLGGHQMETIKANLNKTSQEIADLIKVVTAIKKQLNISDA